MPPTITNLPTTYDELRALVEHRRGVYATKMHTLKRIDGDRKLGVHVRAGIEADLKRHGLGHLPVEVPADQNAYVRIYILGTTIATLIEAVQAPNFYGDTALILAAQLIDKED